MVGVRPGTAGSRAAAVIPGYDGFYIAVGVGMTHIDHARDCDRPSTLRIAFSGTSATSLTPKSTPFASSYCLSKCG